MILLRTAGAAVVCTTAFAFAAFADDAPFGTDKAVAYADALWAEMEDARLVGENEIRSTPYAGLEPHGLILETIDTEITVEGHTGHVIVKKNYGPAGITKEAVANERRKHLKAVTVMFRREKGYDPDHQDWFWVKYDFDGNVMKNPAGKALAGRVAKGADKGCIACHQAAPGDDYVYNFDR